MYRVLLCLGFVVAVIGPQALAEESSGAPSRESAGGAIRGWISELDSDEFAVRQRAMQQILASGEPAVEALIEYAPLGSAEVHQRALAVLEAWLTSDRPKRVLVATRGLKRWVETAPVPLARQAEALLEQARVARETKAIERIRELGGRVDRDGETGHFAIKVGAWNGTARDFAITRDLQLVSRISLEESELDDEVLKHISGRTELKRLYLAGSKVTGAGLKDLQGLSGLTHLSLKNLPIQDAGLAQLPAMESLSGLGLDGTRVTDLGLAHMRRYPKLETLWLEGTDITDAGLIELQDLAELRTLYLANTRATGPGLSNLRHLPALRYVSLMGAKLKPETCRYLGELQQLETLGLDSTDIRDEQIADLAPLQNLRVLWLAKTDLSDAAVQHLLRLKGLAKLYLSDSQLSATGLKQLREGLRGCDVIFEESGK